MDIKAPPQAAVKLLMKRAGRWEKKHRRTAMTALVHPEFREWLRLDLHRNCHVPFVEGKYLGRVIINGIEVVEAEIPFAGIRFS